MYRFQFIKACWFTPMENGLWGLSTFYNGNPGVAKSGVLKTYAKMCGLYTKVLLGSLLDPTDLAGMPVPEKNYVRYLPAQWVHQLNEAENSVLFLDEFRGCTAEVQNAMLRVVHERVVGDVQLHEGCRIVAAANPVEQTSGGYELSPPMNNRFSHFSWKGPSAEQFADYHINGGNARLEEVLDSYEEQERVMNLWGSEYAKAVGLITSFVQKKTDILAQPPHKDGEPAYATHRSWEVVMRILATCEIHNLTPEEKNTLLLGTIGPGPTKELIAFQEMADLPDIEDVLDGKVSFDHDPARPDRTFVVFASCGTMISDPDCKNRVKRANTLWKILKKVSDNRPDLCVRAAKALVSVRDNGIDNKSRTATILNMTDMLEAADYSLSKS